jgi:hypothetical protein
MKWNKKSQRMIEVESYVTLRSQWPETLADFVSLEYNARGHRVVDGHMEWKYFHDEIEAKKWCDAIHDYKN